MGISYFSAFYHRHLIDADSLRSRGLGGIYADLFKVKIKTNTKHFYDNS